MANKHASGFGEEWLPSRQQMEVLPGLVAVEAAPASGANETVHIHRLPFQVRADPSDRAHGHGSPCHGPYFKQRPVLERDVPIWAGARG